MSEVQKTERIMFSVDRMSQDPIDKELKDCIKKNPSTSGEVKCVLTAYKQWDEELNKIYKELRQRLDSQGQEVLKAAQLKWIEYRDKEFKLIDTIYSEDGGTMQSQSRAAGRLELVKIRVLELRSYVETRDQIDPEKVLEQEVFEGISERGDFQEALSNAIQKAKDKLKTNFVTWELNKIFGENGGFVDANHLKVNVTAISLKEATEL